MDAVSVLTLVFSGVAAVGGVTAAVYEITSRGVPKFEAAAHWRDGMGGLGIVPWSGKVRGEITVNVKNLTPHPASDVRLNLHDCSGPASLGVINGGETVTFTLVDVGSQASAILTFAASGRGRRRKQDLMLRRSRPGAE